MRFGSGDNEIGCLESPRGQTSSWKRRRVSDCESLGPPQLDVVPVSFVSQDHFGAPSIEGALFLFQRKKRC